MKFQKNALFQNGCKINKFLIGSKRLFKLFNVMEAISIGRDEDDFLLNSEITT